MKIEVMQVIQHAGEVIVTAIVGWIAHSISKVVQNVSLIPKMRQDLDECFRRIRKFEEKENE